MLQSMTGYGKATGTFESKKITVEIKSLNSKSLDLFVRLSSAYKEKEIDLRKRIGEALDRGKVECIISVENSGDKTANIINHELAAGYYKNLLELGKELNIKIEDPLTIILRMPDIYTVQAEAFNEAEWNAVSALVDEALVKHIEFRNAEGSGLQREFEQRINNIKACFNEVPKYEAARMDGIKARIEGNLEEFIGGAKVDKNRFEQELIYYIEKIDIAEEKHRLAQHLDYFLETMNQPISQGRKLGFITQEIGREINTLGSKSYHTEMQKLVVQMKDELEKIKEQILNTL
jgi:uncharacterized protein (TIGR00255 family)